MTIFMQIFDIIYYIFASISYEMLKVLSQHLPEFWISFKQEMYEMLTKLALFLEDESGATAIEYGLVRALRRRWRLSEVRHT